MSYGQTSAGKTHTLFGDHSSPVNHGIVPRVFSLLSDKMSSSTSKYQVFLSVLEVYNERIRDLLDPAQDNLQVFQNTDGVHIPQATRVEIHDEDEWAKWVLTGMSNRATSATAMNELSSRSHCLVILNIIKIMGAGVIQRSKLCLVDLAGSERLSKTCAEGATQHEGQNINKSLLVLGSVINALNDSKSKSRIPYRDSKLTRLLQDSLGGSAQTCVIVCISPEMANQAETLSSLRFGVRARAVPCTVQPNAAIKIPEMGLLAAQEEIKELKERLASLGDGVEISQQRGRCHSTRRTLRVLICLVATVTQILGFGMYYHATEEQARLC